MILRRRFPLPRARHAWIVSAAIVTATLFRTVVPLPALAARFPNAVEKTIVIRGSAAAAVADLLGLSSRSPSTTLALGRMDAWSVYLLKHDTKETLSNGDGPPRYNRAQFSHSSGGALTIAPYWLDLSTQLPNSKTGYFSFGSPFVAQELHSQDSWTLLVRRLKHNPGWNARGYPQFTQCFTSPDGSDLCINVYGANDYADNRKRDGYTVTFVVHPLR